MADRMLRRMGDITLLGHAFCDGVTSLVSHDASHVWHIWMSHVTHVNASQNAVRPMTHNILSDGVVRHRTHNILCDVTRVDDSYHTCEWVAAHVSKGNGTRIYATHVNASWHTECCAFYDTQHSVWCHMCGQLCHTCEWVAAHVSMSNGTQSYVTHVNASWHVECCACYDAQHSVWCCCALHGLATVSRIDKR